MTPFWIGWNSFPNSFLKYFPLYHCCPNAVPTYKGASTDGLLGNLLLPSCKRMKMTQIQSHIRRHITLASVNNMQQRRKNKKPPLHLHVAYIFNKYHPINCPLSPYFQPFCLFACFVFPGQNMLRQKLKSKTIFAFISTSPLPSWNILEIILNIGPVVVLLLFNQATVNIFLSSMSPTMIFVYLVKYHGPMRMSIARDMVTAERSRAPLAAFCLSSAYTTVPLHWIEWHSRSFYDRASILQSPTLMALLQSLLLTPTDLLSPSLHAWLKDTQGPSSLLPGQIWTFCNSIVYGVER